MSIVFDEVQATIEPPPGGDPRAQSTPATRPEKPRVPLQIELRMLKERQARLVAD
jgi:hypothetical protein